MDLNWLQSALYGLLAGLAEILPVSARAHSSLLLKIFGTGLESNLALLLIHISILAALYYCNQLQIIRISRAIALARIPKRRRKRPLDTKSLMDFRLIRTMIIPVLIGYIYYRKAVILEERLFFIALFLFLNGVILYLPQFLPSGNKDSRTLSRIDGLLMGLGGAVSIFPGISGIGAAVSIGSVCGADRSYSLTLAFFMSMAISACMVVYDFVMIFAEGVGAISLMILLKMVLSAAASFGGAVAGIKVMRSLAEETGYYVFAYYCWGLALFTFILNLMA